MLASGFKVLLDANVLFPLALCDTLLRAADAGLYQPYWSDQILEELENALVREQACSPESAARRVGQMRRYFPEAAVTGFEHFIPAMLNDSGDRHVAAAAVAAGAQVIVTSNLRHFRLQDLPQGIGAQSPDEFLRNLFSLSPERLLQILHEQAEDLEAPPVSFEELLGGLAGTVPSFIDAVRSYIQATN